MIYHSKFARPEDPRWAVVCLYLGSALLVGAIALPFLGAVFLGTIAVIPVW